MLQALVYHKQNDIKKSNIERIHAITKNIIVGVNLMILVFNSVWVNFGAMRMGNYVESNNPFFYWATILLLCIGYFNALIVYVPVCIFVLFLTWFIFTCKFCNGFTPIINHVKGYFGGEQISDTPTVGFTRSQTFKNAINSLKQGSMFTKYKTQEQILAEADEKFALLASDILLMEQQQGLTDDDTCQIDNLQFLKDNIHEKFIEAEGIYTNA